MSLRLTVFYGSVRTHRKGIRAARFVAERCRQRGHDVALVDPAVHRLPLLDRMYKEYDPPDEAPAMLRLIADAVVPADAYLVVSGEYNHNVPPALSNLLDHFLESYFRKPSAIVCYSAGAFGGVRAAVALRSMLAEMGMSSVPTILPIPKVQDALDPEGAPADPRLAERADRLLDELEWYARALKEAREASAEAEKEAARRFDGAVRALAELEKTST
ncbi:MAG TPA: NAD(P)H-dependent oxidoreductase [bacterium]|nr:NAD(P)H-dependent oxidoreductase [bacterium]